MSTYSNRFHLWMANFLMVIAITVVFMFQGLAHASQKPLIFMPFAAGQSWYTVQAPGGSFSHTGDQSNSYDFIRNDGETYGSRVMSPGTGEIVELRTGFRDWQHNSESTANNNYGWGNTLVIKMSFDGDFIYVRMAHLQYGSTNHLVNGDYVEQGAYLGKVGQTGFSTNPHMHIQVQTAVRGASIPFEFVEGFPVKGENVTSRLESELHVVDNRGRINAGSHLDSRTYLGGSWRYYSRRYPTVGSYAVSTSSSAIYRWRFELPRGGYTLYAGYKNYSSRTNSARYKIYGNVSRNMTRYVDQRQLYSGSGPAFSEDLYPLGTVATTMTNNEVTIDLTNQGSGSLCADAIFIKQRW